MRLIFMGTPEFAVPTLLEIVGRGHEVAAVYTAAPKPAAAPPKESPRDARRRQAQEKAEAARRARDARRAK